MTERILQGPFLTRAEAARRAKVPARLLVYRPDLLTVSGKWLPEVYFAFQFDDDGVRPDLGSVVQSLKGKYTDIEISDWLVRPNRLLNHSTPLKFLNGGDAVERVFEAAASEGPVVSATTTADRLQPGPGLRNRDAPTRAASTRWSTRRARARQPVFHSH